MEIKPFNKNISGFKNEDDFMQYLNGRRVCELSPLFDDLFFYLFGEVNSDSIISCRINFNKQKSDIFVKIGGTEKGISIKKGIKNSVHIERLDRFISFLRSIGFGDPVINEVCLFHYGDGTIDGSGSKRVSSLEYKDKHQDKLDMINFYFNQKDVIREAVHRFVLLGNNSKDKIDALIYGTVNDFIWITPSEITEAIMHNIDIKRTGLGFGSLFYQPLNRCLNYNSKYESYRDYIQIKWYHLSDDIIWAMNERFKRKHGLG